MKRPLALLLSILMIMSAIVLPQSSGMTAQAASFTDMNQSQIVSEMGIGWNLGNQLEANFNGTPSETIWGNPQITSTIFRTIKNAGFDTVRIPVSWLSYIGSAPSYTVDSSWMARVKEVVDLAIAEDLYVVINVHGDGYSTVTGGWLLPGAADQTTIKAKFSALWTQIAATFKDYDHHLIFESMNEVGADASYDWETVYNEYTNINDYNQLFVDAVRSAGGNNTKRWLIVPGWNTNIDYTVSEWQNFVLPTDSYNASPRIMVSVHYYSPWEFCGDESYKVTDWGTGSSNNAGWGNEDYMADQLSAMYNRFVSAGYPVFIGEFGCIDKGNTSSRVYWAKTFCEYAKQYGCIPVWWDNGYNGTYGFGLFDRSSGSQTQPDIISAMMKVYGGADSTTTTTTTATTTTTTATTKPTTAPTTPGSTQLKTTPMYRLYNPNSGEHFYTGSTVERDDLIGFGWHYEGIAWNAPVNGGDPVYRLYNPNSGDHHYTMSAEERDMLIGLGWIYENVAWNSASPDNLPLYRMYNPNAICGSHHYTGSTEERDMLVDAGWIYEGIGWFGTLR